MHIYLRNCFPHGVMVITLASSSPRGNEVDRQSLLNFKSEIVSDTLGILSSWNDTSNFCEWRGIACGRRHQRVTVLDLHSSQLKGLLSPHIGNLSFLRTLKLQNNSFNGTIPQEIGRLSRLKVLHLGDNNLYGNIPINISHCSNLQYLVLANNTLSGNLPIEIGSLFKLQVLALRNNHLVGDIPPTFGNLSFLTILSMEENNLQGGIVNSLGQLKRLTHLALDINNLTGTIPSSLYNLSSIEHISVIGNLLHGTLPPGLGYTMFPNLQTFRFQMNSFSGPIPVSISNASHLSHFGISENYFTGKVPTLARVSTLVRVEMGDNNLGNEDGDLDFLSSLGNSTSLELLDIGGNNFQGVLPESISNFSTKLKVMNLGRNQLRGSIPIGVGNLINLGVLNLEENLLTGTIPSSICKISKLYSLFLSRNQLSGTIPFCLGNLTLLSSLVLMSNKLQGGIPQSLGQCMNLLKLVLSQNNLSGSIPQEVIRLPSLSIVLDLSSNRFTGYIPTEVGFSSRLASLNLSENRLAGEVLQSLEGCTGLESLDLSGNMFQGKIPRSLSNLRGLQDIDLSRNNFSGEIPNDLQTLPFFQNLNLSCNNFSGEVPIEGVFSNTTEFSIIGNTLLCGGVPQLKLPRCPGSGGVPQSTSDQHYLHKPKSFFMLILVISAFSLAIGFVLVLFFVVLYRSSKDKVEPISIPLLDISLLKLSYGDLFRATDGFSSQNLIGAGSSGSVYWGVLDQQQERIVAVKVLNLQSSRASKSFEAECEVFKSIRHRNLTKLVTVCSSIDFQGNEFKALVFEFMLDGNLDEWLHYSDHRVVGAPTVHVHLNLIQRVNIAMDIATALDYLHNSFHIPIVHCDLKPSNVLLEKDMTACVCDFGLPTNLRDTSWSVPSLESSSNSIRRSTGYAAPEYGMGNAVSTYGDIYSYGILVLDMLTGKRPTDDMFTDDMNLHNFVLMALPERVKEICDPVLLQGTESSTSTIPTTNRNDVQNDDQTQRVEQCLISIARIGVACSVAFPKERMEIGKVVAELREIRNVLTGTRMLGEQLS